MTDIVSAESVLRVGQRVEFFINDDTEALLSRIEDVRRGKLIVAMPIDSKLRPVIPKNDDRLYGVAISPGCRFRFFTSYRDKAMENVPVWIVDFPETVERFQNREFVRVSISLPIKVRVMEEDGSFGPLTKTHMIDISGGGVSFSWSKPIPDGTSLTLEINNIPGVGTLQLMGMVVRSMRLDTDDKPIFLIGVRMLNLSRPVRNRLVKYIFDVQRQDLAKGINNAY